MSKELNFIKNNPMGFLATTDENNRPRVRGWGIIITDDGIAFGTSNDKKVFKQLKTNPYVEWITMSKNSTTLRVSGNIVFEEDSQIKLDTIENNPMIKSIYAGREDKFELFYLENIEYDWFELKLPLPSK